ncbi:DNA repair protein RAD52 homolog [Pectinophora gossypiella]|uniref:DNA repair protein RAD52 homolog n=1 Tax=Pectinophora gossypiella TaxID=13191 RepID=UPI00214EB229|nr:DNA repair protein RAD52 homolog [Pectinophora gossypiella]
MQRKPGYPVANCNIKMPDGGPSLDLLAAEEDGEHVQRRQQLINFGHTQWGFNNWSWSVTKQELDFVDFANGKYCAGVVAFVSVTVKSFDIHRENIGYATSLASNKGAAIYKSRKCAVTNALRETLLSFGGSVANELMELIESHKSEVSPAPEAENNQNIANKHTEPKNAPLNRNIRKDSFDSVCSTANNMRSPHPPVPTIKNAPVVPSVQVPPVQVPPVQVPPVQVPPVQVPPVQVPPVPVPPVQVPPTARCAAPRARPSNPNEPRLDSMSEEEARAERKRRQQRAQEQFRLRQAGKMKQDDNQESKPNSHSSGFDSLLMDIPTQDIEIISSHSGDDGKRTSPAGDPHTKRRATTMSRLDIVTD